MELLDKIISAVQTHKAVGDVKVEVLKSENFLITTTYIDGFIVCQTHVPLHMEKSPYCITDENFIDEISQKIKQRFVTGK